MKTCFFGCGILLALTLGCSERQSDNTQSTAPRAAAPQEAAPPGEKQFRIKGIHKVDFPQGGSALVLEYETDIRIDDKQALSDEVATIWTRFQKDVEKAELKAAVIRATHYEGTGFFRSGKGQGFVFRMADDGTWQLLDDSKQK